MVLIKKNISAIENDGEGLLSIGYLGRSYLKMKGVNHT